MSNKKKGGLLALLTGVAAGAVAVFLSKKENREKTKEAVREASTKAKKAVKSAHKKASKKTGTEQKKSTKKKK